MTPTARTLEHYRRQGYAVGIVERWIEKYGIRRDLFGILDIIAVKVGEPVLGIQSTVAGCVSARLAKARQTPDLPTWLATGARFVVIGWATKEGRWLPRIEEVTLGTVGALAVATVSKPPRKRPKSRWAAPDLFAAET